MNDVFWCDNCDEKVRVDFIEPRHSRNEARGHCTLCRVVLWFGHKDKSPGIRRMERQRRRAKTNETQLTMFEGVR